MTRLRHDQLLARQYENQMQQQASVFRLIFFVVLFYLFLQAENMRQLQLRNGHISAFGSQHKKFVLNQGVVNPRVAAKHMVDPPSNPDDNPTGMKHRGIILHGVPEAQLKYYRPFEKEVEVDGETTTKLLWKCLGNPEIEIEWRTVNNNYCDCPDGSDEPGTSACKNGKFYCETEKHFINSDKVNDGICDCCDGSDEWKGVNIRDDEFKTFPENARLAPCKNECSKIKMEQELEEDIYRQGRELKEDTYDKFYESSKNLRFGRSQNFHSFLALFCDP